MVQKLLSVVIPAYNEENSIRDIIEKVSKVKLPNGWDKEIIIVDDKSTDSTGEIISTYNSNHKVVLKTINGGKGSALKEGFKVAKGDYVIIQDADLEYNPDEYTKLLAPIISGEAEIVFGSRVHGLNNVAYSKVYYYGGLLLSKIFNICFGTRLTDVATCYKVFPSKYLPGLIKLPADDFVYDFAELTHHLATNGNIIEVPISYNSRTSKEGKKLNAMHGFRCLKRVLELKFK